MGNTRENWLMEALAPLQAAVWGRQMAINLDDIR